MIVDEIETMKKSRAKLYSFGIILGFFVVLLCIIFWIRETNGTTETIGLKASTAGIPAVNQQFTASNFETVYNKIKNGSFASKDIDSSSWYKLGKDFSEENGVITFPNGLGIGKNVKNDDAQAKSILKFLLGSGYNQQVQVFNGTPGTGVSFILNNSVRFHLSGNAQKYFTNTKGESEAKLSMGMTAIFDGSGNFVKLADINEKTRNIRVDMANLNPNLSMTITNLSAKSKDVFNQYTVEYGQSIHYQLKVSKTWLTTKSSAIQLKPSANLKIDKISVDGKSVPYDRISLLPDVLNLTTYGQTFTPNTDPKDGTVNQFNTTNIGNNLLLQSIYGYNFSLASSHSDVNVNISAHVAPSVSVDRKIGLSSGVTSALSIPINAYRSPSAVFNLSAVAIKGTKTMVCQSQNVNTSGINFAMVDGSDGQFAKGAQYVLGKEVNGQKYLYSDSKKWERVDSLETIDTSYYFTLSGGKQYALDKSTGSAIVLNSALFDFNAKRDRSINQSLIKIIGLSPNNNYFLYQVKDADNQQSGSKLQDFTVFNQAIITPDGSQIQKNSIGFAHTQSYALNGKIPDYAAGTNEYNLISVNTAAARGSGSTVRIVLSIIIAALLIIGSTIYLLRKY